MPTLGRRHFLRLTGLTATGLALPGCITKALEIPAHSCSRSLMDVEHVVILLQENRAFDHYFGTMAGVRGFGDRFTAPVADAPSLFHQRDGDGNVVLPYHLDETAGNAQRVEGTPHSFVDAQLAWNHGRYGRWASWKSERAMGYYTQQELPFQFALAEAFTLCDAYFCGMHAGTNPNRLVAFTGTNDPTGEQGGPAVDNSHDTLGDPAEGYTWTTYAERLQDAGVSWKVYQDMADNFTDNPLVGFQSFRAAERDDPSSPLARLGVSTTLTNDDLEGLRADVLAGQLPSVSWIIGPAEYSEHPGPSCPAQGAVYVQQVLEALTADPETWSKTVLLVTFDENDGFFDHVPPPCAPSARRDGTVMGASTVDDSAERHEAAAVIFGGAPPYGPGPRVPMWVVSPFSRGGWVCSENLDHTSILRFLEARFGVEEPNISAFRRAFSGDLCSAFDFENPNDDAVPPLAGYTRAEASQLRDSQELLDPVPAPTGAAGAMPRQAQGTRPSRALPYALYVDAEVGAEPQGVQLDFLNHGRVGAVFHVYDHLHLEDIPRRYAVGSGDALSDTIPVTDPGGAYELTILGPNGFFRWLRGAASATSETQGLEVEARYRGQTETLELTLHNRSERAQTCLVSARAYTDPSPVRVEVRARGQQTLRLDVSAAGRWYDYEVTVADDATFARRVAGRIENGLPSISDPAFGTT
ncbi:MAG: phospholipase C, phosphocholine-specific [Polyangiales bacterium]